jgi:hypothetical protein
MFSSQANKLPSNTVNDGPCAFLPFTVIATFPVVALAGTSTTSCVAEADETVAATPLNVTWFSAAVVLKFVPVIVTSVPVTPLVGLNPLIVVVTGTGSGSGSIPSSEPPLLQPANNVRQIDIIIIDDKFN